MFIVHFFFFSAEWDLRNRQEGPYLSLCLQIRIDTCNHTWKVARWAFFPPWTCQYRRWPVSGGNRNHVRCAANTGDRVVYLNSPPSMTKTSQSKLLICEILYPRGSLLFWKLFSFSVLKMNKHILICGQAPASTDLTLHTCQSPMTKRDLH